MALRQSKPGSVAGTWAASGLAGQMFIVLGVVAILYAFLAGLRTLSEFDLGWQLATGRWIAQHRQIPSIDVFSYTVPGQPWIYPVGSSLLFYGVYLLGQDALLSWLAAAAGAATIALTLRRGSAATAMLAILAVPLIAIRIRPRADMFTVVLFAAFLSLLWQHRQSGHARLWLLPLLMAAWVNLHLGFIAGLALGAGYLAVETLELIRPERRGAALERLRRAWPWLAASLGATLANPWGWGVYAAVARQDEAMTVQAQWIPEWGAAPLNWTVLTQALSLRNPGGAFHLMLLIAAITVPVAVLRRQLGAAILLSGAALLAIRHIRFEALFAIVMVVVAGTVLNSAIGALPARLGSSRWSARLAVGAACAAILLAGLRSADLVSNRTYLASSDLGSFGTGLSWWFPQRAADFIERETLPGQIFNSYNEGGYLTWRLGERYPDYIDGRAIPFGPKLFERNRVLLATAPNSPEWQREEALYGIDTLIVPLGRYSGLRLFPVLRQFCAGDRWQPVYLDEVSAVFVRRSPTTEDLIERLRIECLTAPLPAVVPPDGSPEAFDRWANAAALLQALGRNAEAFDATAQALAIFPDSAFIHFLRGALFDERRDLSGAEQEYKLSVRLEPNGTAWSRLGAIFHREGRLIDEIDAWEHASETLPDPAPELLSLGYADLAAARPRAAVAAVDRVAAGLPEQFSADLAHGRARAWSALGDADRAVPFQEEVLKLRPDSADDWLELADLYDRAHRTADGQQARGRAAAIGLRQKPSNGKRPDR